MDTTTIIKSDIRVVAIDETRHWIDRIQKACGKIEAVYIYDASVQTNLCEITPSYYLETMYYVTEKEISDEMWSELNANMSENDAYHHCNGIDAMESLSANNNIDFETSESEEYKEHYEEVKEYCNCNHLI